MHHNNLIILLCDNLTYNPDSINTDDINSGIVSFTMTVKQSLFKKYTIHFTIKSANHQAVNSVWKIESIVIEENFGDRQRFPISENIITEIRNSEEIGKLINNIVKNAHNQSLYNNNSPSGLFYRLLIRRTRNFNSANCCPY